MMCEITEELLYVLEKFYGKKPQGKKPYELLFMMQQEPIDVVRIKKDYHHYFADQKMPVRLPNIPEINLVVEGNVHIKGEVLIGKNVHIENGTNIYGPVVIGDGVRIQCNSVLRGPAILNNDCLLGSYAGLRGPGAYLGVSSILGEYSGIVRTALLSKASLAHYAAVADSVIGQRVECGGFVVFSNLNHTNKESKIYWNGDYESVINRRFGAIVDPDIKIGSATSIMPGTHITQESTPLAGVCIVYGPGKVKRLFEQ